MTAVLAIVLGGIALGIFLPPRGARVAVLLAAAVAAVIWVVGENFGGMSAVGHRPELRPDPHAAGGRVLASPADQCWRWAGIAEVGRAGTLQPWMYQAAT